MGLKCKTTYDASVFDKSEPVETSISDSSAEQKKQSQKSSSKAIKDVVMMDVPEPVGSPYESSLACQLKEAMKESNICDKTKLLPQDGRFYCSKKRILVHHLDR